MPVKKEKKDVARTTILVLLVLTIILSVISTWYVLDMVNSVKQQYASMPAITHGQVTVAIAKPGEAPTASGATSTATGKIVLAIQKPSSKI